MTIETILRLSAVVREAILNWRWSLAGRNQGLGRIDRLESVPISKLGTQYGEWCFSEQYLSKSPCLLSAGVGEDCSFDLEFARKFCARVILVDPTPRAIQHYRALEKRLAGESKSVSFLTGGRQVDISGLKPHQVSLVQKALFSSAGLMKFYPPKKKQHVSYSIVNLQRTENREAEILEIDAVTVSQIVSDCAIEKLDCVKFDIEGVAADVVTNMLSDGIRPRQIMVELEELLRPTRQNEMSLLKMTNALSENGYCLANRQGVLNFLFIRP